MNTRNEKPTAKDTTPAEMRLLMHACCGPCSMEPLRLWHERDVAPTIFYENGNIHPASEYEHRLETLRAWAASDDPVITAPIPVVEGAYDAAAWERTVGQIGDHAIELAEAFVQDATNEDSPRVIAYREALGGGASPEAALTLAVDPVLREKRCRLCYRARFEASATYAKENGFTAIGSTLSVSPYQYTDVIREELERAAAAQEIDARFEDYRPYYDEATRRSRERGMYRQNNCGCRISDLEAQAERAQRKARRAQAKAAEAQAHAEERAAEQEKRDAKRAEKRAYNEKQARKRAILKAMREQANDGK